MEKAKIIVLVLLSLVTIQTFGQKKKKSDKPTQIELKTQLDTVSYCLGLTLGNSMKKGGVDQLNSDLFITAINQVYKGDSGKFNQTKINEILQNYFVTLQKTKKDKNLTAGKDFLEKNKATKGLVVLPSGLQYLVLQEGKGAKPNVTDTVTVNYHGTLIDGRVFDSSVDRKEPIQFPIDKLIPAWKEALPLMTVGSKWKLFVPSELGYGENPNPNGIIEPNMVLIFEIELISIDQKMKQ
jgi:FKBP-type peptidyl-prolyl cis-trans isomerase FklB